MRQVGAASMSLPDSLCAMMALVLLSATTAQMNKTTEALGTTELPTPTPRDRPLDPMRDMSAEKMLLNVLLDNYQRVGRSGRPVLDVNKTLMVLFSLGLIKMDLDEKEKILSMSMWTRYQWRDEYLTWRPAAYGGVQSIRVDPHQLWIPDITLYNAADPEDDTHKALAVITYDGLVTWYPQTIFRSSCSVDVTNFPFDRQQCHLWFGSWTYTSRQVDLRMGIAEGIDLSTFKADYNESCAWAIVNVTARRVLMPSAKSDPNFVVLQFNVNIKRKLVFSSYILTLPCVFLACLTLVVFWLPPERPDRTALAMSSFSSFMVLLLILVEAAPPTASSVPTLGLYYCFNMVIIVLSIILSSLVVNLCRSTDKPAPRWLYRMTIGSADNIRHIARLLCGKMQRVSKYDAGDDVTSASHPLTTLVRDMVPLTPMNNYLPGTKAETVVAGEAERKLVGLEEQIGRINRTLVDIQSNLDAPTARKCASNFHMSDWAQIARFLDRFFFVVYIILIILSLTFLFPRPT